MSATIQAQIARLTTRREKYEASLDKALKAQSFKAGDVSATLPQVEALQKQIDNLDRRINKLQGLIPKFATAKFYGV
ncbi:hypothetical protein P0Y35_11765 [Kiritimatiellaeota bacterium B1221]|nr:hypothetical protein [Kiritimatiellaeota bacterium B1221]